MATKINWSNADVVTRDRSILLFPSPPLTINDCTSVASVVVATRLTVTLPREFDEIVIESAPLPVTVSVAVSASNTDVTLRQTRASKVST